MLEDDLSYRHKCNIYFNVFADLNFIVGSTESGLSCNSFSVSILLESLSTLSFIFVCSESNSWFLFLNFRFAFCCDSVTLAFISWLFWMASILEWTKACQVLSFILLILTSIFAAIWWICSTSSLRHISNSLAFFYLL